MSTLSSSTLASGALCVLLLLPARGALAQDAAEEDLGTYSARVAQMVDKLSSHTLQQLGQARAERDQPTVRCLDGTLAELHGVMRKIERLQMGYLGEPADRRRTRLGFLEERARALSCQASACLPRPLKRSR